MVVLVLVVAGLGCGGWLGWQWWVGRQAVNGQAGPRPAAVAPADAGPGRAAAAGDAAPALDDLPVLDDLPTEAAAPGGEIDIDQLIDQALSAADRRLARLGAMDRRLGEIQARIDLWQGRADHAQRALAEAERQWQVADRRRPATIDEENERRIYRYNAGRIVERARLELHPLQVQLMNAQDMRAAIEAGRL